VTARLALAALLALALASPTAAAADAPTPLFASDAPLRLTLKAPFGDLPRERREPEPSVPGELALAGPDPETLAVTVAGRGKTRRSRETCAFPPLRIAFPEKPPQGSLFAGQKSLKLVTHCQGARDHQPHLILEYGAYRLYNRLTPVSFRARLATIDYVEANGRPVTSRLGFFIEDADDMARRNGLREQEITTTIPVAQLEPAAAVRFALFQDMIGNLDWAMTAGPGGDKCCHNSRPVAAKGATTGFIPVPFDFDYSGLVNAPYAVPPEQVKVSSVRVRRYRGFCRHNDALDAEAARVLALREELLGELRALPGLDAGDRSDALAYLGGFFERVASPAAVAQRLKATCI